MLKRAESKQMKMSFVTLEELMPQEHFLRDLDRLVDFDFIYDTYERRKKRDTKRVHKQAKQRRTYYKR